LSEFAAKEKWAFAHSFLRASADSRQARTNSSAISGYSSSALISNIPEPGSTQYGQFSIQLPPGVAMAGKGIYHRHRMARAINIAAAVLCLICVIALCIAPSVDIPDTTLKSLQIVFLMMLILVAGVFLPTGTVELPFGSRFRDGQRSALVRSPLLPIQLNNVQQC
jgi:hypothetical protein